MPNSDCQSLDVSPNTTIDNTRLVMRRPDDWHVHLRDGAMLEAVVEYTARQFARAIIMPNLSTPITTVALGQAYQARILKAISLKKTPTDHSFDPLMTCYLTDDINSSEIETGFKSGLFAACKLYPANATTNSSHGVSDIVHIYGALEMMQKINMPLLVHGEVTDSEIDIFDREAVFIDRIMSQIVKDFPSLKIVFEHITTKDAVDFVEASGPNIAATITPHHLEFNRNAIFAGGIRPHYYCLPVAKREQHRLALRKAATSGSGKFFLGTDSAPHLIGDKEAACGCAGLFNAPFAMESYAKTFEEEGALDKLELFASVNGPQFYGLPLNETLITLVKKPTQVPQTIDSNTIKIVPFHAGEQLAWTFES